MKKRSILSLLFTGLALLASVSQVFAGAAPQTGQATETPTPTLRTNPATQMAILESTRQASKNGPREHYKGTVTATDQTSLTITLSDGSSLTFALDPRTRILYAAPKGSRSGHIRPGDTAMVQATRSNETLTAQIVMVMPGKPSRAHHIGVVTEYVPGVKIVIQDRNGNTRAFALNASTQVLPADRAGTLATGQQVTIIALRDQAANTDRAIGIVILSPAP
jgi:hypothetical protein